MPIGFKKPHRHDPTHLPSASLPPIDDVDDGMPFSGRRGQPARQPDPELIIGLGFDRFHATWPAHITSTKKEMLLLAIPVLQKMIEMSITVDEAPVVATIMRTSDAKDAAE